MIDATQGADYTCEVYHGLDGLVKLKKEWDALFLTIETPAYYQDWRWMHAVVKCLVKDHALFVVFRKFNEVAMIMPLQLDAVRRTGINQSILSFPRHNHIVLSDILSNTTLFEPADFNRVITYLSSREFDDWNLLELKGICANSQICSLLTTTGTQLSEISQNAYFLVNNGEFESTLSKKFIKNIKRLSNKAEKEAGEVQASFVTDLESLSSSIEIFFNLEASGWKGEKGTKTAIKHHTELVNFYLELQNSFSIDNSFSINILEIGGEAAAAQLCIRCGTVWYVLKIAYHEDFGRYGSGNILLLSFLQEVCLDHGVEEVNLVTSPPWADRWHLKKRSVYSCQYFNNNIRGRLTKAILDVKSKIKKLKHIESRKS